MICYEWKCEKPGEFEIYDSSDHSDDPQPVISCEDHVGSLLDHREGVHVTGQAEWSVYRVKE